MPQRTATIESLPMAFEVVKQMQADGLEWGEGYRPLCRRALAEIIEGRMAAAVDGWLDGSAVRDPAQRQLFAPSVDRAWRHRACCAALPALLPDRGAARLRPPTVCGDRPRHPGRFRAWTQHPQGRRGPAGPARPPPSAGLPGPWTRRSTPSMPDRSPTPTRR